MLNEEQIEDILYRYVKRQDEFNMSVITIITDRLSRVADFDKISSLNTLSTMTEDISKINQEYLSYKKDQKKRIHDDFWILIAYLYEEAAIYYAVVRALEANEELVEATNQAIEDAQNRFEELTKNPVFVIRDLRNTTTLKPYSLEETYKTIINEVMSYQGVSEELMANALRRTETQLFNGGIRYLTNDSSDETVSADRAVRMNILDSVRGFINKVQDIMGKQFGADGVELSAHICPAPDHAPAQGHQYTLDNMNKIQSGSDFEDVNGNHYAGFERQIGTWNCRHYFMKIKLGSKPAYTQDELDKILEDNERGYTTPNGKHYTLYECTQIQRRYERRIRDAKTDYLFAKSLGDKNRMMSSRGKVGDLTTQYKMFSNACGLPAKLERIRVKDY